MAAGTAIEMIIGVFKQTKIVVLLKPQRAAVTKHIFNIDDSLAYFNKSTTDPVALNKLIFEKMHMYV